MPGPLGIRDDQELTSEQEEKLRYIEEYDLTPETSAAVESGDLSREEADAAEHELKRYLAAVFLEGGPAARIAPTAVIDDLWHRFILNTPSYHRFCAAVYGEYLHHDPTVAKGSISGRDTVRRLFEGVHEGPWVGEERWCVPH